VVLTGIRLSIYGDALGDRTGLGNGLIGLVFLAGVTSLPEVVVSLTSVIQATDPARLPWKGILNINPQEPKIFLLIKLIEVFVIHQKIRAKRHLNFRHFSSLQSL